MREIIEAILKRIKGRSYFNGYVHTAIQGFSFGIGFVLAAYALQRIFGLFLIAS